jgi:hypothetical protein
VRAAQATAYPTFLQQQQQQRELWQEQEARWLLLQQQQQLQDEADESWEYLPDDDAAAADAAADPPGYTDAAEIPSASQVRLPAAAVAATTTASPAAEQLSDAEKQRVLLETLRRLQMIPANAAAGMQLSFLLVVPPAEALEPAAAARAASAAAAAGSVQKASSGSSHSSESRDHTARLRTGVVGSAMLTATPQGMTVGKSAQQQQQQRMFGGLASAAVAGVAGNTEGLAGGVGQAAQPAVGSKRAASVALHDSVMSAVAAAKRVLRDAPPWMG